MKNRTALIFLIAAIFLSLANLAYAAKNNGSGSSGSSNVTSSEQGSSAQGSQPSTVTPTQSPKNISPSSKPAVQVQNQIETQNQGEDSQLMINTQESTSLKATNSGMAEEKMSVVAQQVEELLNNQTIEGGVGEQVKQIATEQKLVQDQIKTQLQQVENRKGIVKVLIGPDYKALKNVELQIEQNRLRIEQLMVLQSQLTNQNDINMVKATISAMAEQNSQLQDKIATEEKSKSMLGWLFKFFSK